MTTGPATTSTPFEAAARSDNGGRLSPDMEAARGASSPSPLPTVSPRSPRFAPTVSTPVGVAMQDGIILTPSRCFGATSTGHNNLHYLEGRTFIYPAGRHVVVYNATDNSTALIPAHEKVRLLCV